jgi:hypothetical protein
MKFYGANNAAAAVALTALTNCYQSGFLGNKRRQSIPTE